MMRVLYVGAIAVALTVVGAGAPTAARATNPPPSAPASAPAAETAVAPPKLPPFDVAVLATGVRASRVMGKAVRNEAGDDIGTVNDLIINPPDNVAYAIIGVGGFLGVGERLVAVPFDSLQPKEAGNGLVLPGATKDSVKLLPEFKYPPRPEKPQN